MQLRAAQADITRLAVDAIVNAANRQLKGGGGVDGAIHRAAGPALLDACARLGGCDPGDACTTPGFDLTPAWVIHTVGPIWRGGGHGEARILASCYRRCIEEATRLDVETMAFPAISAGVYGYPDDDAAAVAVETLRSLDREHRLGSVKEITLVGFDRAMADRYRRLLAE